MKTLSVLTCFIFLAVMGLAQVDLDKPVPVIRLADGRVLKNVQFTRFTKDKVTTKSNLGTLLIVYEYLPDDIRAEAEKRRPGGPRWFAGDTSGNTTTVEGQVFVTTKGASTYKFGSVNVYAFDLVALDYFRSGNPVRLPKPINVTQTDADGKFALKVPADRAFFVFAQASRLVGVEVLRKEWFEWRVPMSDIRHGKPLNLSEQNYLPVSNVEIEPVP